MDILSQKADNGDDIMEQGSKKSSEEDRRLKQAATIGTGLMVVNSHRALVLM